MRATISVWGIHLSILCRDWWPGLFWLLGKKWVVSDGVYSFKCVFCVCSRVVPETNSSHLKSWMVGILSPFLLGCGLVSGVGLLLVSGSVYFRTFLRSKHVDLQIASVLLICRFICLASAQHGFPWLQWLQRCPNGRMKVFGVNIELKKRPCPILEFFVFQWHYPSWS